MSADKYLSIFSRQMEAIVYLYHASEIAAIKYHEDLAIFLVCL